MMDNPLDFIDDETEKVGRYTVLYRSTSYRLNDYRCPYCLAENKGVEPKLNTDDLYECPSCQLTFLFDPLPKGMKSIVVVGFLGKGNFKVTQTRNVLFHDLMILHPERETLRIIQSDEEMRGLAKRV